MPFSKSLFVRNFRRESVVMSWVMDHKLEPILIVSHTRLLHLIFSLHAKLI